MEQKLGQIIGQLREERGISQQQLADGVGVTRPYITQIENGKKVPSDAVIERIFLRLGVPLQDVAAQLFDLDSPDHAFIRASLQMQALLMEYLTEAQYLEVSALMASSDMTDAGVRMLVDQTPLPPGPDGWLELSKTDRSLVQRVVNRLRVKGGESHG